LPVRVHVAQALVRHTLSTISFNNFSRSFEIWFVPTLRKLACTPRLYFSVPRSQAYQQQACG
jgi:hypothetical protein